MKTSRFLRPLALIAACALLPPTATSAQTTTGWVNQVLSPGIVVTNALGQVLVRGIVHTERLQGPDARTTGQVLILGQADFNADGTANAQGTGYLQVGTWDTAGTSFTPNVGFWQTTWSGVVQPDYSGTYHIAGYGIGGSIDGLRLNLTLTVPPQHSLLDPTVPYLYTGTIKPPPVSANLVADDFNGGVHGWTFLCGQANGGTMSGANGQLVTSADWRGLPPWYAFMAGPQANWSLADGQTLECQADLVGMSGDDASVARIWAGGCSATYELDLGMHGAIGLVKWSPGTTFTGTAFWETNVASLRPTNVVLYIALTRDQENLLITTRVLDKANPNAVLFERTFWDTAGVDASLTAAQAAALSGIAEVANVVVSPDPGPPFFSGTGGGVGLGLFASATQPLQATWDNFSLRLHDVPPVSIARAVQLTWPTPTGVNYAVEGAPTVNGPWSPVQELTTPGLQKQTVPVSSPAQFFRLIQAP